MKSKIIQFQAAQTYVDGTYRYDLSIIALCEDGSLWITKPVLTASRLGKDKWTLLHGYDDAGDFFDLEEVSDKTFASQPIEDLAITMRSINCLHSQSIRTVGELVEQSEVDLIGIPGLGKGSLSEIINALALKGLALRPHRERP